MEKEKESNVVIFIVGGPTILSNIFYFYTFLTTSQGIVLRGPQ